MYSIMTMNKAVSKTYTHVACTCTKVGKYIDYIQNGIKVESFKTFLLNMTWNQNISKHVKPYDIKWDQSNILLRANQRPLGRSGWLFLLLNLPCVFPVFPSGIPAIKIDCKLIGKRNLTVIQFITFWLDIVDFF